MKVIKTETRDVAQGEVLQLDLCNNADGSTVVGEVYIDLKEDNTIAVSGSVDRVNYHTVNVVNMCDYSIADEITSAGYFLIPTAGLAKLKLEVEDEGTITIKELF